MPAEYEEPLVSRAGVIAPSSQPDRKPFISSDPGLPSSQAGPWHSFVLEPRSTSVQGYLTTEVLELAGNTARNNKKTRIVPHHLQLVVLLSKKAENK